MKTLKIGKHRNKIFVTWSNKPIFWTQDLKFATVVALTLHLLGILLFPIDWGSWIKSSGRSAPIEVTHDYMSATASAHAPLENICAPKHLFAYQRLSFNPASLSHLPHIDLLPSNKDDKKRYDYESSPSLASEISFAKE